MLVNGDRMAGLALYTATNTGPLPPGPDGKAMPPTNKAIGMYVAHTIELDPTGANAVREATYVDEGTMMAQLGLNPGSRTESREGDGRACADRHRQRRRQGTGER
jgi:hypothetical protein